MSVIEMIPLAKSAKCPPSATPKLSKSKTENDAPNWKLSKTFAAVPVILSLIKSIIVNAVRIPDPTTSPTIWLLLRADENSPTAKVADAYNRSPSKPDKIGPTSGSP